MSVNERLEKEPGSASDLKPWRLLWVFILFEGFSGTQKGDTIADKKFAPLRIITNYVFAQLGCTFFCGLALCKRV